MQSLFVASPGMRLPDVPPASQQAVESADLLRQLIDVQREHLHLARMLAMNNDAILRWRRFLEKYKDEYPRIPAMCRTVLPNVEKMYLNLMSELTERLETESDDLENEFLLSEFLDKYGMRLNQLSTIMNQLTPIADVAAVLQAEAEAEAKTKEAAQSSESSAG